MFDRQLEAFRAVMMTGGMTAGAEVLHVTQPAVSRLIRDLEYNLKIRLFERRGNQLSPTPEAVALLAEVERSYLGLEHVKAFAADLRSARAGSLRVAALPALALGFLPFLMARFRATRPGLAVQIDGIPSHLVLDRVAGGQFDFGFVAVPAERSSLVMAPMMAPIVAVVPTDRRLARLAEIRASDLAGEDVILLGRGSYQRHIIEVALAGISIRSTVETPLSAIACALASEGVGIALVEAYTARAFIGRGVVVLPFRPAIDAGFSIVTARQRALSQAARDFLDVVEVGSVDYLRPLMGAIRG
ncbi:LysR family transcriptional regulator [Phreatobacter sp.]|uniref:LysR family transcriptional regulator n=1 Tax=Phreatobacter sp. TaxID=1966341 RepID=UPI0025D8B351|nr:LysR family transcriptional regulator [Phreatobacter sp.]